MHDHGAHADFDSEAVARYAEAEGEALLGLTGQMIAVVAQAAQARHLPIRRVIDVGSGPGVGTGCLAEALAPATVLAVDGSAVMVARAVGRAGRMGLSDRVQALRADLPDGLGALGEADVVWASMVLHHVPDEAAALRSIAGLLRPGGLLALVEHAGPVRVVPEDVDLGRPGLWERLDAAWAVWFTDMRAALPGSRPSPGYPELLAAAGFELLVDEVLTDIQAPPLDDVALRFAQDQVVRAGVQLAHYADGDDLAALRSLLDDDGALRHPEATLQASRHLYLAAAR
jgi:SAM-dependent methyltransferase